MAGCGVVFKLDGTNTEAVLHAFTGLADGAHPSVVLVRDKDGNLYGSTLDGGQVNCSAGCGVVFKLDGTNTETVLHTFTGGVDGATPSGSLVRDNEGNLYGTTFGGGIQNCGGGCGVVFKVDPAGVETPLHIFTGFGADGAIPYGGLIQDKSGNLYGTASNGGAFGVGTVFKVTP